MASINSQRPPSGLGTFVLGVAGLAVFATLIVLWVKVTAPQHDAAEAERAAGRIKKRQELEQEAASKISAVAWVDKEKGVVQLPIDDAMRLVAVELAGKKVAKSEVKVPAPLPMPVADPKATEPPPLALPSSPQGAELIHFANHPGASSPSMPAQPTGTPAQPAGTPAQPTGTPAQPAGTPAQPAGTPAQPAGTPAQPVEPPAPAAETPAPSAEAAHSRLPAPNAPLARPSLINWTEPK